MSIQPSAPLPEDPALAAAVAHAENRREKLERLSDMGMIMVEQCGAHASAALAAPAEKNQVDPSRAYAVLSRAIRMTLALEARFDDHILALRRGEIPAAPRTRAAAEPAKAADVEVAQPVAKVHDPRRDQVDVAVREAIHIVVENITDARERLDALNERLFDRETYDILLKLPLREAVAAVCADLDVDPDWTLWTDDAETGFVAPPGRRRVDWTTLVALSFPPKRPAKPPPRRRQ